MKNIFTHFRFGRLVRLAVAGVVLAWGSLLRAADAPADGPAPAAAPAAAPAGAGYVFSPPKEGEVVALAMRVKLLSVVKTIVERDNPALLAKLTSAENPFYLKLAPPPTPTSSSAATGPAEPPPPPKLTDEDKLKQVAAALKPTGLIEAGSIRLVTFASRDAIQVGQSFPVPFPNESAPSVIQVIDANESSCLLKLGDTTYSADFVSNASATPASHPAPAASPPSTTK
jgi:hypothetical protein